MIFERTKLSGMFAAALLCVGIGAPQAGARTACEPPAARATAAAPLCQPAGYRAAADMSGRFRVAQILPFDCYDRCIADFKTCMGENSSNGPPKTQLPPGSGNTVPTPPPYEFCIGVQDQCIATCKEASGRKTRF